MTSYGIAQLVLYAVLLVVLGVPLGAYMARVYTGRATTAQKILGPFERVRSRTTTR
jgi:K+-transporting ATPase A subunit